MEHLGPHAQSFPERGGRVGHHHELLKIQGVAGMGAAVEQIHEGNRQHRSHGASQVAIEG